MTKEKVLARLERAEGYVTGSRMSEDLGISRAAVWKGVEALRREGYVIRSAPNRGYRLEGGPDRISPGLLAGAGKQVGVVVECLEQVDSTNNYLKLRAAQGAPHGLAATAEEQTGGRGRLGRSFESPKGKGLYLSVLLRPDCPPAQAVELTAWTAVAVCRAVEGLTGLRPEVKWTNDVLLEGKKLCGILTEMGVEGETGALQYVVVGAGINVGQTVGDFSPEVARVATSLAMHMPNPPARAAMARALLGELDRMWSAFPRGREEYLAEYRARCVTLGRAVEVHSPGGVRRGFAGGLDERFRLLVEFEDGAVGTVDGGEVSVRGIG